MVHIISSVIRNSILITGLVLTMMLMIEYFNIHSHGKWFKRIEGSKYKQVILGSLLGTIPGCIGGFAAVSLYTHKLISFGALVAMMIASSGDEAFVIMAMIPKEAFILFAILIGISIIVGLLIDYIFYKGHNIAFCDNSFELHHSNNHDTHIPSIFKLSSYKVLRRPSKERVIILIGITLFLGAVILGILECGHNHAIGEVCTEHGCTHHHNSHNTHSINLLDEQWINIIFATISIITIFFTATAKEHFIKEHLWNHVIKKHLFSIFLWTFGTLLICNIGMQYLNIEQWITNNMLVVLLIAIAVGIIPESGPHMIFITLYAQGVIPFYILIANSIVQDGHTALPLLAESKISFAKAKLINIIVGLIIGLGCWLLQ